MSISTKRDVELSREGKSERERDREGEIERERVRENDEKMMINDIYYVKRVYNSS